MNNAEITLRLANPEDSTFWDSYVDSHTQGTPYHKSAWLNAVFSSYRFSQHSIIAYDTNTQHVVGVFPLVLMNVPLKGKSLCALPYCDVGGPLYDSETVYNAMLDYAHELLPKLKAKTLQIRQCHPDKLDEAQLHGQKVRMLLSLPPDSESLMASFKSKLRSQIRKAEKNGLTYTAGNDPTLLNDFYDVYCTNMRDLGSPAHHKSWFINVIKFYGHNALVSVVYHEDKAIGAGIVLFNSDIACIPWASTKQSYNRLAPNMLLYWSVLAATADKKVTMFDFGRSTFNEGTYKFKKQWGATPLKLNWQTFDANQRKIGHDDGATKSSNLRAKIESIWKKLPLGLTIFIGGRIRRYIDL